MKRVAVVLFLVSLAAACSDLFDTAVQCTTDRDCQKYGAVCDVSHGVCIASGSQTPGDGSAPPPPGSPDADLEDAPPPPPECNITNKTVADIVPGIVDGGDTEITASTTLDCTKDWRLGGRIFVRSGATLTIQAGTTIRAVANAALVIQPGAQIVAQGQRNAPIVFTSEKATPAPGDWRGLYVLGNAPPAGGTIDGDANLAYGGTNAADASGTLAFVRIEYSGYGLALGGVGNGTLIDFVEVRKTTNNAFSFFGGTADAKHLVTQYPGDEAFEMSGGYAGRLQFLFSQKMPRGSGDHHGVLDDGANPVIYNATLCNDSKVEANYALVPRNAAKLDMGNSILTGFFGGVDVVNPGAPLPVPLELRGSIAFDNTGNPAFIEDPDGGAPQFLDDDNGFDEIAWFNDATRKNVTTNPNLVNCNNDTTPNPWPQNAITTNARTPPAGFFDTSATYIGAFKDQNDTWMNGAWVRFSAQ